MHLVSDRTHRWHYACCHWFLSWVFQIKGHSAIFRCSVLEIFDNAFTACEYSHFVFIVLFLLLLFFISNVNFLCKYRWLWTNLLDRLGLDRSEFIIYLVFEYILLDFLLLLIYVFWGLRQWATVNIAHVNHFSFIVANLMLVNYNQVYILILILLAIFFFFLLFVLFLIIIFMIIIIELLQFIYHINPFNCISCIVFGIVVRSVKIIVLIESFEL